METKGNPLLHGEIIAKCKNTLNKKKFSETSRPILIKLDANHTQVKGIQIVRIKAHVLFKGNIITKMQKYGESFRNLLKNYRTRKTQILMKASSHNVDSHLHKLLSPGVGWGQNGKIILYVFVLEISLRIFPRSDCPLDPHMGDGGSLLLITSMVCLFFLTIGF
jgi:hypothetical protein